TPPSMTASSSSRSNGAVAISRHSAAFASRDKSELSQAMRRDHFGLLQANLALWSRSRFDLAQRRLGSPESPQIYGHLRVSTWGKHPNFEILGKRHPPGPNDQNRSSARPPAAATAKPEIKSSVYVRPSVPVRSGPLPEGPLGPMGASMRFAR